VVRAGSMAESISATNGDPRQYIVADPVSREAAVIDPVLDYDSASGTLSTSAADGLLTFIAEKGLKVVRFLYVEC
jgi:hypothetical protein